MFKFFFKPKIKTTLIKGGNAVKIAIIRANAEQTIVMLFLTINQIAKDMGLDPRNLMNRMLDLDKTIQKARKKEKKQAYTEAQKAKHQK